MRPTNLSKFSRVAVLLIAVAAAATLMVSAGQQTLAADPSGVVSLEVTASDPNDPITCNTPSAPTKCTYTVGAAPFTVSVRVNKARVDPPGSGYVAFLTTVIWENSVLTYKPRGNCQPKPPTIGDPVCQPDLSGNGVTNVEVVWPEADGLITRIQDKQDGFGAVEYLAAACLGTALSDPCDDDSSTFVGDVLDLQFNCSSVGSGLILFADNRQFKFVTDKAFEPSGGLIPLPGGTIENNLSINCVAQAPPPLGGSGVFPDVPGAGGSSWANYGVLAGVLAAVTAGALALGGAAWYRRRI